MQGTVYRENAGDAKKICGMGRGSPGPGVLYEQRSMVTAIR